MPSYLASCSSHFPCGCDEQDRSEEHTSELQSHLNLVCRLLLEKKKRIYIINVLIRIVAYHKAVDPEETEVQPSKCVERLAAWVVIGHCTTLVAAEVVEDLRHSL